jgi:hypothetical protein
MRLTIRCLTPYDVNMYNLQVVTSIKLRGAKIQPTGITLPIAITSHIRPTYGEKIATPLCVTDSSARLRKTRPRILSTGVAESRAAVCLRNRVECGWRLGQYRVVQMDGGQCFSLCSIPPRLCPCSGGRLMPTSAELYLEAEYYNAAGAWTTTTIKSTNVLSANDVGSR